MIEEGTPQYDVSASPGTQGRGGFAEGSFIGLFQPGEYDRSGWLEKVVPIAARLYREDSNL